MDVHAHRADPDAGPRQRVADLDRMGIDVQLVGPVPAGLDPADEDEAARLVEATNEQIAAYCAEAPQRLLGLGTVTPRHPVLAVRQIEYAVERLGLRGFVVPTSVGDHQLGDMRHDPVWECAEALRAVVFVHPAECIASARLAGTFLGDTLGHPVQTVVALSELIFGGVLDRFPDLKILAPYGGGFLPTSIGRSDHAWTVRPDARGCRRQPSEYLGQLWFDSLVYTPQGLESLVEAVGPGRVVLGTGYPFDLGVTDPLDRLDASLLSDSTRDRIRSGNARRLLATRCSEGLPA